MGEHRAHRKGLFVGARQNGAGPRQACAREVRHEPLDQRRLKLFARVADHPHRALVGAHGRQGFGFQALLNARHKGVAVGHHVDGAAEIFRHFVTHRVALGDELLHEAPRGPAERIDVLIVVAHGDDAHGLIGFDERVDQVGFLIVHVLRFVDHEDRFAHARGLCRAAADFGGRLFDDALGFFQGAVAAEHVKGKGVKGFDVHKVGGLANELDEALFKFRGRRPREGEHQQLLGAHVFAHQKARELVHEHAALRPPRQTAPARR